MIKYTVAGISTCNGREVGLMLTNLDIKVTTHFSYDEIKDKLIKGAIQVSRVTLVDDEIVIEGREMFGTFPVDGRENNEVAKDIALTIFSVGDELKDAIEDIKGFRKRYLFEDLVRWVDGRRAPLVAALYGLRRTGKSVLLLQICEHYVKLGKKVAYAELDARTNNDDFLMELHRLARNKYDLIVIDEITYLEGFLGWGNRLSDRYARSGVKIIIAGTQSLMLEAARYEILFDRMEMFNTTYISYQEFESLYGKSTVLDYIRCGGVLSTSRLVKDEGKSLGKIADGAVLSPKIVKDEPLKDYVNTAIIGNIKHTLESYESANTQWHRVFEKNHAGSLKGVIQLYLMTCSEKALIDGKGKDFVDRYLASALQMRRKKIKLDKTDKIRISNYTKDALGIPIDLKLDADLVKDLNRLMKQLDLLIDATEYRGSEFTENTFPIFIQPGLQYDQAMQTVNSITKHMRDISINKEDAEELKKVIMSDIEGRSLETVIMLNLIKLIEVRSNITDVFSLNVGGKEVDIVVRTGSEDVTLIEVKRNNEIVPNQYRWLCDEEFNGIIEENIGKITRRIVIYMGKSQIYKADGYEILYINATDWLLTTDITKEMMNRSK